jgi:hypothetical protein
MSLIRTVNDNAMRDDEMSTHGMGKRLHDGYVCTTNALRAALAQRAAEAATAKPAAASPRSSRRRIMS